MAMLLDSTAWNALGGLAVRRRWKMKLSYRYAFFEGDDPDTVENEAFDGLFTGFYDWSTWWQGEIAGGYLISNSNLISNQLRLTREAHRVDLDRADLLRLQAGSAGVVRSRRDVVGHAARSSTGTWTGRINGNFIVSFVAAVAEPGDAIEQS